MSLKFSNRSWIILSTVVFILLAFAVYFLVYVKNKEKAIVANNFRVLQQVVQNIKTLEETYLANARIMSMSPGSDENNPNLELIENGYTGDRPEKNQIIYNDKGLYFNIVLSRDYKSYFTRYDAFFSNTLFQRKDVFDQIIITKVQEEENGKVKGRKVLYSNEPVGILDSAFRKKELRGARDEITINDRTYISFNQKIHDDQHIYISALVLKSKFIQQKRNVSSFVIFTMSIVLSLIILAIPLLKLSIMGIEERLYTHDVIFSVISILIGPTVFMVFLYTSLIFFGEEKTKLNGNLKHLSTEIEDNFRREMTRMVHQLESFNNRFGRVKDFSKIDSIGEKKYRFRLDPQSRLLNSSFYKEYKQKDNNLNEVKGYRVFKEVIRDDSVEFKHLKATFWADHRAWGLVVLSSFSRPGYAQKLDHRKYLTNILNGMPDYFKDVDGKVYEIAPESIKSVTDGAYEIGVGMATGGKVLPVLAMSAKLASVMGTVLEEGYGFCIIDRDGNTMFHSDIIKNMNENFVNETRGEFKHAIATNSTVLKTTNYNGKDRRMYFRPMECLSDHYIITWVNSDVYYGPFTVSMLSAFIMFLAYLILLGVVYIIMYFSASASSKLKSRVYLLNLIRPYETPDHLLKHTQIVRVSAILIAYLVITLFTNKFQFDFLIGELFLITFTLLIFSLHALTEILPYRKELSETKARNWNKIINLVAVLIMLIPLFRTVNFIIEGKSVGLIINSTLGFLMVLLIIADVQFGMNLTKKPLSAIKFDDVQKAFKSHMYLWVVIFSLIPINLFLRLTQEKEDAIFARYRSLELLNRRATWDKVIEQEFESKFDDPDLFRLFKNSMKKDHIFIALGQRTSLDTVKSITTDSIFNPFFNGIYAVIRPDFNERLTLTNHFIGEWSDAGRWIYDKDKNQNIFIVENDKSKPRPANKVVMEKADFFRDNWLYLVMVAIVSLLILHKLLRFALDKIYGFRYKNFALNSGEINATTFSDHFIKTRITCEDNSYNNIFTVGINAANTYYVKNYLAEHFKDTFFTIDFYDLEETYDENIGINERVFSLLNNGNKYKDKSAVEKIFDRAEGDVYVFIEHFEYGYNDVKLNRQKLAVLRYLSEWPDLRILVSSEISTTKLFDYYSGTIRKLEGLIKNASGSERLDLLAKVDELRADYKKWQHILGSFVKTIIPINVFPHEDELAHGEFLDTVNRYLKQDGDTVLAGEDRILAIQQMCHPYYISIWNSLYKDERYIIFDIAKNGFVNTSNATAITGLLKKGILVYDYSLRIMNESFANFVLTKVSSDEALEMEMVSRKKGAWSTAFAVIFLLIISLVLFLSIGQKSFLNELNAFITAIVALLGVLIRFSGLLTFGGRSMK